MSGSRTKVFVVPHTHWDREWYKPLAHFRMRLVDVIDSVLELLGDVRWRRFTLDGQSVILEDYLAFRPEREAELSELVREGRLRIGPWFVLPDEFLVSPEALVRNLQLGRKVASRFGPVMPVLYSPDAFGHIGQLPLLATGFGMDSIMFERGVGDEGEQLGSEFTWVASDSETEVFAAHLVGTYSGGTALGHASWEYLDEYDPDRTRAHVRAALYGVAGDLIPGLPEWFSDALGRVNGGLVGQTRSRALVLLNGSDHLFPQPSLLRALEDARADNPDFDFVLGDVTEYVGAARATALNLTRYQGEFRSSRYQHILSGVLSTRIYLKQANHACETLLERYAEPLAAIAGLSGTAPDRSFLEQAWRELLENHPHDSICGCSIDPVHREMMTRFGRVGQMGQEICRRAWGSLGGVEKINIQDADALASGRMAVFNPLPVARRAVADHEFLLPRGESRRLAVFDSDGNRLPSHIRAEPAMVPGTTDGSLERVSLTVLAAMPPLGFANLRLGAAGAGAEDPPLVITEVGADVTLDNGLVRLVVGQAGRIELHDLASGFVRVLELALEDVADAGDEYDFSPLVDDAPLLFNQPRVRPHPGGGDSGLRRSVRLEYLLQLPAGLSEDRLRREGELSVPLTLDLTLEAESRVVGLRVAFDNQARDHRLRLHVSTGIGADTVLADGHFDVVERPLAPTPATGWFQTPQGSNHQRRFVAVSDGERGLAVLNHGLSEYEATQSEGGTVLGVTLLRGVGWLSRNDLTSRPQGAGPALPTPEAQCLGPISCRLGILAFSGPWWKSGLLEHAQAFTAPPLPFEGAAVRSAGPVSVDGPVELTALKPAVDGDGFILRLSNPSPEPAEALLSFRDRPAAVHVTRLDETRLGELAPTEDLRLRMAARSVTSLRVSTQGGG